MLSVFEIHASNFADGNAGASRSVLPRARQDEAHALE